MSQLEISRDGSIYTMETSKHIKSWKPAKKTQTLKNPNQIKQKCGNKVLKCEVKWALGSITMNKVSGGDGSPVELFQMTKLYDRN